MYKRLLLSGVSAFVCVAGAQAADWSVKARSVEYVQVCSAYGAGFFYLPGTDTCLQVSGYLRADFYANGVAAFNPYISGQISNDNLDRYTSFARGIVYLDARTETEWGTLRGYMGVGGHVFSWDKNLIASHYFPRAFLQFAGLTAGYTQSFFDPVDAGRTFLYTTAYTRSDRWTNLLAYTHEFGGGLSGTVSLEDGTFRNEGIGPYYNAARGEGDEQGGNAMPDVVLNLRLERDWGAVQLNGALHQVRVATLQSDYDSSVDKMGWALGGVVSFKLPMLAAGDEIYFTGAYADGAMSYAGLSGNPTSPSPRVLGQINGDLQGGAYYLTADAVWNGVNDYHTSTAWSVSTQFRHYLLKNLRANFYAGYISVDTADSAYGKQHGYMDLDLWQVGGGMAWFPARQLEIGVEVIYSRIDGSEPFMVNGCTSAYNGVNFSCGGSVGTWTGGLRFQRFF